jgi:hypothetical protein
MQERSAGGKRRVDGGRGDGDRHVSVTPDDADERVLGLAVHDGTVDEERLEGFGLLRNVDELTACLVPASGTPQARYGSIRVSQATAHTGADRVPTGPFVPANGQPPQRWVHAGAAS